MPTSAHQTIAPILETIIEVNPKTVLDIGSGYGKYGLLCREYLPELKRIDEVEVFEGYQKLWPGRSQLYDETYINNALTFSPKIQYDLVLIIDVIEHWPKEEATTTLLTLLKARCKVLVSTPRSVGEQGAVNGNEWERHISQWQGEDFENIAMKAWVPYKEVRNDWHFIYLLG